MSVKTVNHTNIGSVGELQCGSVFIHYYSQKSRSACKLFISAPHASQEAILGKMFGIIEFNTPSRENGAMISRIISVLEDAYYSDVDEAGTTPESIEHIFESALEHVNETFPEIIKQTPGYLVGMLTPETVTEKINACVGVIRGKELYIAPVNTMGALLVHQGKQDYSIVDIVKSGAEGDTSRTGKLFTSVISGTVAPNDYVVLANKSFLDFVSLERIRKIVSSLPPHKAAEYFKNALLQYEGYTFAGLILHNRSSDVRAHQHSPSLTSIGELNTTESATERLLSPSIVPSFREVSSSVKSFFSKRADGTQQLIPDSPTKRVVATTTAAIKTSAARTARTVGVGISTALSRITGSVFSHERFSHMYKYIRLKLAVVAQVIGRIPNISKLLLILALISGGILAYSVFFISHTQNQTALDDAFHTQALAIENTIAQAQAKAIIGDETAAHLIIADVQAQLSELIIDSSRQRAEYQRLAGMMQDMVSQLRKITVVTPSVMSTLPAEARIASLVSFNDRYYAFDEATRSIYEIAISGGEANHLVSGESALEGLTMALARDRSILLYTARGFFSLNTVARTLTALPSSYTSNDRIIFAWYGDRLYTLNAAKQQIIRTTLSDNQIAPGLQWLAEAVPLTDAIGIGIDTNIWVGHASGAITKLSRGRIAPFNRASVDPALTSAVGFYTNETSQFLYALDAENKRMVVFKKSGELVTQYYSDTFTALRSFEIDEQNKRAVVVSGNSIYTFPLSHL